MVHSLETANLACSLLRVKSHCVKTQQVSHAVLQAISTTYWAGLWLLERLPDDFLKNSILFGFILFCSMLFVVLPHGMWDLCPPNRDQPVPPAVEAHGLSHCVSLCFWCSRILGRQCSSSQKSLFSKALASLSCPLKLWVCFYYFLLLLLRILLGHYGIWRLVEIP